MVLFQLAKFVFWRPLRSTAVQTRAAPSNSLGTLETRSIKSATLVSHQCAEWETLTQRLTKHLVRQFASIIIASDEGFPHRKFRLFGWKHDIEIGKAQHFANTTQLPPFFFCVCVYQVLVLTKFKGLHGKDSFNKNNGNLAALKQLKVKVLWFDKKNGKFIESSEFQHQSACLNCDHFIFIDGSKLSGKRPHLGWNWTPMGWNTYTGNSFNCNKKAAG